MVHRPLKANEWNCGIYVSVWIGHGMVNDPGMTTPCRHRIGFFSILLASFSIDNGRKTIFEGVVFLIRIVLITANHHHHFIILLLAGKKFHFYFHFSAHKYFLHLLYFEAVSIRSCIRFVRSYPSVFIHEFHFVDSKYETKKFPAAVTSLVFAWFCSSSTFYLISRLTFSSRNWTYEKLSEFPIEWFRWVEIMFVCYDFRVLLVVLQIALATHKFW